MNDPAEGTAEWDVLHDEKMMAVTFGRTECPTPHCHRRTGHDGSCAYGPFAAIVTGDKVTLNVGPGGVCNICGEDWPL